MAFAQGCCARGLLAGGNLQTVVMTCRMYWLSRRGVVMNAPANIVEIDESNAQQLLIDESLTRPWWWISGPIGASPVSS
jgi:hypothetical protein